MRSEAYKLSGFTLVIGALGFLLRWLQDMRIAGEAGLADHAPISYLVLLLMAVTAVLLWLLCLRLKQFDEPQRPADAFGGHTPFYGAIALLPAVVLALGGVVMAMKPGDNVLWPTMHRICGGTMVLGAFGLGVLAVNAGKEGKEGACRAAACLVGLFALFWLITGYRDAASDPVVWRFVVGILARCAILLGVHHAVGFFFDSPHARRAIYMCNFAAFLCVMSAIDGSTLAGEDMDLSYLAQSAAYIAMAMQFLIWGFVFTENLKTKPLTPVDREKK